MYIYIHTYTHTHIYTYLLYLVTLKIVSQSWRNGFNSGHKWWKDHFLYVEGHGRWWWKSLCFLCLLRAKLLQPCRALWTQWTVARQAPLSKGSSRQESWSGSPHPPPGDLPEPGMTLRLLRVLHWQVATLPPAQPGKPSSACWRALPLVWRTPADNLRQERVTPGVAGTCASNRTRELFCFALIPPFCRDPWLFWLVNRGRSRNFCDLAPWWWLLIMMGIECDCSVPCT